MQANAPLTIQGQGIPSIVLDISRKLMKNGYQAFIVGGAIRDSLLGFEVKDWDVATNAMPEKIYDLFPGMTRFHLKHGTVTLVYRGKNYEVTAFRGKEGFGHNIEEDLAHRDFTFNALAYDIINRRIIDPFGGKKDMANKVVRAVLDPLERFQEDPLRMMRAIRFSLELEYSIEPETLMAMTSMASAIDTVAQERIRDELLRIVMLKKPSRGLNLMRKTGLLQRVLPELVEGYRKRQNNYHRYTIYRHTMETVDSVEPDPVLRLCALFHDIAKPRVREKIKERWRFLGHATASAELTKDIMMRLRFSNEWTDRVTSLVAHHMFDYKQELSDRAMRRFIKRIGVDNIGDLMRLRKADDLAHGWGRGFEKDINAFEERIYAILKKSPPLGVSDLAVNGRDVMDVLGLQPGPKIGKILKQLLDVVIEKPECNQKHKLIQILEETKER
ncbi:MAG: HD domain-containing protein [Desulfobacterales bacterium]|nr:HD domain-containing protein [Desulfobacterales bacterium]